MQPLPEILTDEQERKLASDSSGAIFETLLSFLAMIG
jgi:hypothetical protein